MRVRRTHNCLVYSKPWMQQPRLNTYQRLSRDHSLLDHLPGGSLPLPSGVSHELSYPARFNPNFYAFGTHWLRETRQHFKQINQQSVMGEADLCRK